MAEPITNVLGVVAMKTRGEYNSETTYEKLNVVTYQGSSYCAKMDTQGNLPTNTTYWDLIAEKGAKGDAPTRGVDYYTEADKEAIEEDLSEDVTTEVSSQLSELTSATPEVVSSAASMTDTSKIYVNTTDGNWYWYNGETWAVGGVYQSTGLELDSVAFNNLNDKLSKDLYGYSTDANTLQLFRLSTYNLTNAIYLKKGTIITFDSDFVSNYHWNLRKIRNSLLDLVSMFSYTTDTSYTVTEDVFAVISWEPIDSDWSSETYDVDRNHFLTNDDLTSIKYYFPLKNGMLLKDIDSYLLKAQLYVGNIAGTTPSASNKRIGITKPIKSKYPIKFNVKDGYQFQVTQWTTGGEDKAKISDTNWITDDFVLNANVWFTFSSRKPNDAVIDNIADYKDILTLSSYADFLYTKNYIDERVDRVSTYNYDGIQLDFQIKHGYENEKLIDTIVATTSSQGFDIYDGKIVQLYNGGVLQIIDIETETQLAEKWGLGFGHGNTCHFSNKKYDENDILPLLYVVSNSYPAVVHVIRIASYNDITNIKQYNLGIEAGYNSVQFFDFNRRLIYSFGYKNDDFQTPENNNGTIIRTYDLNSEILISGTEYSLNAVDTFEDRFFYCIQGGKYFNGLCYFVSSYEPAVQKTYIYVYDVEQRKVVATFTGMPTVLANAESEDLSFMENEDGTKYDMIVGTRTIYEKLSFL